jgi:hypothetical protein
MKVTTLVINTCATCPHIRHKSEGDTTGYGYYCDYSDEWIPESVNILKDIWLGCQLAGLGG